MLEIIFLLLQSYQEFALYDSILENEEGKKSLLRRKGRK